MSFLKTQIEKTAKEINATEIEVISAMQTECANRGDEKAILELHTLKMEYIKRDHSELL